MESTLSGPHHIDGKKPKISDQEAELGREF